MSTEISLRPENLVSDSPVTAECRNNNLQICLWIEFLPTEIITPYSLPILMCIWVYCNNPSKLCMVWNYEFIELLPTFYEIYGVFLPQKQIHWLVLKKKATCESTYPSTWSNSHSIIPGVYAVLVEDGVTNKVVEDALDYFAKNRWQW